MRLARRDLSRHKIRTLVGVLLFALPVALTVGFFSMVESYDKGQANAPLDNAGYVNFHVASPEDASFEDGAVDDTRYERDASEWLDTTGTVLRDILGDQTDTLSPGLFHTGEASHGDRSGEISVMSVTDPADGGDPIVPAGEIFLSKQDAYLLDVSTGDTVTVDGAELTATVTRAWGTSAANAADVASDDITGSIQWYYPADPDISQDIHQALSGSISELHADGYEAWPQEPVERSHQTIDYGRWTSLDGELSDNAEMILTVVSVAVLMILLISAVISPVFAVAARRLRHAMGLLSAGGAAPSDLRRIMLAQGVLVSVAGAALGLLGSVGVGAALNSIVTRGEFTWAWDIAIPVVLVTLVCGVTSALIPAIRAGREDPVQALADGGSERMTGFRKRMLTGIPFLVLGAFCCLIKYDFLVLGVALLGIGLIASGSLLVWAMSRIGGRLPTTARLAVRDGQRNHHRTIPAVAAVSGVTFLAALMISVPIGDPEPTQFGKDVAIVTGSVGGDETTYAADIDTVADKLEAREKTAVSSVTGAERNGEQMYPSAQRPDGYRNPDAYYYPDWDNFGPYTHGLSLQQDVAVHDGSAFAAFNRIPTNDVNRAEQALADGKAVVGDPDLITDGYVSIDLLGMASVEASSSAWAEDTSPDSVHDTTIRDPEVMDSLKVPAVAIESVAGALGSPFISISPATAESLDLEVTYESTVLLLEHDVSTLQAMLVSSGTWPVDHDFVDVETPGVDGARAAFTATPIVLSWLLTLGTVLLVVLLATNESRRDMATITAMGAPPGTLRRFSATQAVSVAAVGTLAGVLTGLLPAALLWLTGDLPGFLTARQWTGVGLTVLIGPALAWLAGQAIGAATSRDDQVARRRD